MVRRIGTVAGISNLPNTVDINLGGDNTGNTWDSGNTVPCAYDNKYKPVVGDTVVLVGVPGDYYVLGTYIDVNQSIWTGLSFATNITNFGSPWDNAAWLKVGSVVYLRGILKCTGAIAASGPLFTMPAGTRITPTSTNGLVIPIHSGFSNINANAYMDSSGVMRTQAAIASGAWSLGGLSYVADS